MPSALVTEFRNRRLQLGTQAEAARQLVVSVRYIQKLEAGHAAPSGTLMKLLRMMTQAPAAEAPRRRRRQSAGMAAQGSGMQPALKVSLAGMGIDSRIAAAGDDYQHALEALRGKIMEAICGGQTLNQLQTRIRRGNYSRLPSAVV